MKRYAIAVVLLALLGTFASAQVPPPIGKPQPLPGTAPPGPGGPAPKPGTASIVIPVTAVKPPQGFYKSGGVLVGADGYFPFDTGDYLLGGTQGLTRSTGLFYMIPSASNGSAYAGPTVEASASVYATGRHRFFHRQ